MKKKAILGISSVALVSLIIVLSFIFWSHKPRPVEAQGCINLSLAGCYVDITDGLKSCTQTYAVAIHGGTLCPVSGSAASFDQVTPTAACNFNQYRACAWILTLCATR